MKQTTDPSPPGRRATWSWIVYDLANTIFALGVLGLYFPSWLTDAGLPDLALSTVVSSSAVVVVFLAPWIGARTDALNQRVRALVLTTLIAVGATATLASGPVWMSLLGLGVALIAFNTGSVVYDALLPEVSTPADRGRVSGLGVGVGYVGSFVGLGIGAVVLEVLGGGYAAVFRSLAAGFLLFSIPIFIWVRERPRPVETPPRVRDMAVRIVGAWRLATRFPGMVRFLLGRFLYTDAINTLIGGFLAIYAIQELGLDPGQTTTLLGVAIAAAIPGSIVAGRAVDRFGPLAVLKATLVTWIVALVVGVAAGTDGGTSFVAWLIAPLGGAALGATWASDRVLMTELSPPEHLGEMYGLYATVGRFATILGPLIWGLIVDVMDLPRTWALGALAVFVGVSLVVLSGLDRVRAPDEASSS
ncbi:MAG TPA: MFS transporter [Acidimicrobiia bacterium]|nr:MFS transporter [Acidimicrobiia bacterium]